MLGVAVGLTLLTTLGNVVGSVLTVLGVRTDARGQARLRVLLGFAGGFILAGALVEVFPHSIEEAPLWGPLLAVGGYLLLFSLERLFAARAHASTPVSPHEHTLPHELEHPHSPLTPVAGVVALAGFLLHDFVDGLGIGAGFAEGEGLGVFLLLAVLLHEVPAGAAVASLMLGSGRGRLAALAAGTAIGLVTVAAVPIPFLLGEIAPEVPAALLGLAAGSFLYIAAHSLIPVAVRERGLGGLVPVVIGVALGMATALLLPNGGGHTHTH
ncbi:MAG: ZIP family metal transporter [Dehalococcoidia bacterium]|nr:ZIP family metal transporter [Dehalococcoidia bacterium]MDW8120299.1 ZIP family metal transporter [Chloroflexota bacterium]